ncbi:MAG: 16S rRNA (cytosine(1402)-N(4))-methyltransferase RsmH [Deltaproteobacteria bacterium]|nr:16S rRNA (cytosine(1402)-N(4))-methyltransferase RsmH [Deltaproteobacteria bacterium]
MSYEHTSVMPKEVINYLNCTNGKIIADCTIGGAGHSKLICEKIISKGLLIGIDQDPDAIKNAYNALSDYKDNIKIFYDNFKNLPSILSEAGVDKADGIIADLGISFNQIEYGGRGFSFQKEEPLDMRMNPKTFLTAEKIINAFEEKKLISIFKDYGEEPRARFIAKRIIEERKKEKITSSVRLAKIVEKAAYRKKKGRYKIHPATKVFMALRIAVNNELGILEKFIEDGVDSLASKGRICIISFHSLEDRIVKHKIKAMAKGCICPADFVKCVCGKKPKIKIITKKAIIPSDEEVRLNRKARSAKLRVAEKI